MKSILLIALFIPTLAYADVVITTKAGATLEWKSYTEKDGQYCTVKFGGDFCISKSDVVSIKDEERNSGYGVIYKGPATNNNTSPSANDGRKDQKLNEIEQELSKRKIERDKQQAECNDLEKKYKSSGGGETLGAWFAGTLSTAKLKNAVEDCNSKVKSIDRKISQLEQNQIQLLNNSSSNTIVDNSEIIEKLDSIEKQQKKQNRKSKTTDFKCVNDCTQAGYSYNLCTSRCSY